MPDKADLIAHTAQIVAAYASRNDVKDLHALINEVHATLSKLAAEQRHVGRSEVAPAVPVDKSVTPDYIVCLEDGKKMKMLKRYLKSAYNMTPAQYREKWGLPADYPMTAPKYAEKRSSLAKKSGLGKK